MFANQLRLTLREDDAERPVPKAWLDQFFLRSFTGYSAFDETLPVADGELEVSHSVQPQQVREHFEKWLHGRKMISPDTILAVTPADQSTK